VLNVNADHLGLRGIQTVEQLARVKQLVVEAVPRHGHAVLNADDPLVVEMRRACSGQVIYFSMAETPSPLVTDHCRRGGTAVLLDRSELGDMITIVHGRRRMPLAHTHLLPATFGGRAAMNVQNAMAAVGAAYAAGAHLHDIRQGLRTFAPSYYQSPGRLNLTELDGVRVLVDYCHNAPGMRMLGEFVEKLAEDVGPGADFVRIRRIGVIAAAGDRRDQDLRDLGLAAAPHFDRIVVREDANRRGRPPGEAAELIMSGVREAMATGARCREVTCVLDEIEAVGEALARAHPGDLVVVCVDQARAVWDELQTRTSRAQAGARGGDPDEV
jgi:cyanophycin synthetase